MRQKGSTFTIVFSVLLLAHALWPAVIWSSDYDGKKLPRFSISIAVGDSYFAERGYDQKRVKKVVSQAIGYLESENIVGFNWDHKINSFNDYPLDIDTPRLKFIKQKLEELNSNPKTTVQILVGFINYEPLGSGAVDDEKRIILVNNNKKYTPEQEALKLIHEFLHVFGAVHTGTGDQDSVMASCACVLKIDRDNLARVLKYRHLRTFSANDRGQILPRQIDINIAVDQFYIKDNPDWEKEIKEIIGKTNEIFGNLPRPITFRIKEIIVWQSKPTKDSEELLYTLDGIRFKERSQITIGFSGQEYEDEIGRAILEGDLVLVLNNRGLNWPKNLREYNVNEQAAILIHEIGHIFGADHVEDMGSYMHHSEPSARYFFDKESLEIIMKNRDRKF